MYWSEIKKSQHKLKTLPLSAKAVITTRNGKILLMQKPNGIYDLPGGKIEKGETLFGGLKREIREETGLKLKKFTFVASWVRQSQGYTPRLIVIFKAPITKGSRGLPVDLSQEHEWYKFLHPDKALQYAMDPGFKAAIAAATMKRIHV